MHKLQVVQNKALRFAFNIKWYDFKTNKEIHKMKPIHMPVNQVLYWRAKKIWEAIDSGAAMRLPCGGQSQLHGTSNLYSPYNNMICNVHKFLFSYFYVL